MSGWVEAFIVIAAIALVLQMAILLAMFIQVRAALEKFNKISTEFQNRMGPILLRVSRILEDSEDRIHSIMTDASELTRVARSQAQKADRVFTEALDRLRTQVLRVDQIITGTLEVVEDTGSRLKRTVWSPFLHASALLKGLKMGIDTFRGFRQRDEEPVTEDEELFI